MKKLLLSLVACFGVLAANAWTVYFTNPNGWDEVAVWAWAEGSDGADMMGTGWPGKLMTMENGVWAYTQSDDNGVPTSIIFNNNGNNEQTADLDFVNDATYDMNGVVEEGGNTPDVPEGPGPEISDKPAPEALYLLGGPAGWWGEDAEPNATYELDLYEPGVFYIENVEFTDNLYFSFASVAGGWDATNANRVAPLEKDEIFNLTEGNPFVWGVDASWQMEDAGSYNFYVNFNSMKVATTFEANVKTLNAANNGEEVIYNLQGVRVNRANAAPGIYIVNGKKTVIR